MNYMFAILYLVHHVAPQYSPNGDVAEMDAGNAKAMANHQSVKLVAYAAQGISTSQVVKDVIWRAQRRKEMRRFAKAFD